MARQSKVDELLTQVTNPALRAFLEGFKDVTDLAEPICLGEKTGPADLDPPRNEAQAKGRELAASLLHHMIY